MKMKEFGLPGGGVPGAPLDPPMMSNLICINKENIIILKE